MLTSAGMAIGLVTAAAFTPILRSLVFGVSPLDLATFTVTPVALTAAAMLASYLPARRAVSIDPVDTLRSE